MSLKTTLCDLLGIEYPIIQGGMAWIATSELAAAVSQAGGLGVIGAGNAPSEDVRREIRKLKDSTSNPFGLNVYLMSPYAEQIIQIAIEEKVPVVTTGGGNPGKYISGLKNAGIKVFSVVASVNLAKRLERLGIDAVIAEGMEAGGHVGEIATMPLVPQIVDAVSVPVIAAGGIFDGRGLIAALALGACGVQIGTRFVCATECTVHANYKKALIKARDRSAIVTGLSTGHPVRVLNNRFAREFLQAELKGFSKLELERLGQGALKRAAIDGDVEHGSIMAGQVASMVYREETCEQIIQSIVIGAGKAVKQISSFISVSSKNLPQQKMCKL